MVMNFWTFLSARIWLKAIQVALSNLVACLLNEKGSVIKPTLGNFKVDRFSDRYG